MLQVVVFPRVPVKNIALAYVKNNKEICTGAIIQVMIREKLHDAKVVKRPFVEKTKQGIIFIILKFNKRRK